MWQSWRRVAAETPLAIEANFPECVAKIGQLWILVRIFTLRQDGCRRIDIFMLQATFLALYVKNTVATLKFVIEIGAAHLLLRIWSRVFNAFVDDLEPLPYFGETQYIAEIRRPVGISEYRINGCVR
ncbi:hypothetical protein D3C87_1249450 [compost metagenome]